MCVCLFISLSPLFGTRSYFASANDIDLLCFGGLLTMMILESKRVHFWSWAPVKECEETFEKCNKFEASTRLYCKRPKVILYSLATRGVAGGGGRRSIILIVTFVSNHDTDVIYHDNCILLSRRPVHCMRRRWK